MQLRCVIWKINHIHQMAEKHISSCLKRDQIPVLRSHMPLFFILPENGEGILFHDLVERWNSSKSSTSEIVAKYEALGYVTKCTCGEDKRSIYISLTPEGFAMKQKLQKIESDFLEEILKGYTDEEKELFGEFLDRVIQ